MTELTDEAVKALLDGATDGPWRSDDVAVRLEDKSLVALVYGNGRGLFSANARLIAAAPDLARALLDTRAKLARLRTDAQAAVALVVEQCADEVRGSNLGLDINDIADDVRALSATPTREKPCPRCGSYGFGCYECTPTGEESYDWRSRGTKTEDGYNG